MNAVHFFNLFFLQSNIGFLILIGIFLILLMWLEIVPNLWFTAIELRRADTQSGQTRSRICRVGKRALRTQKISPDWSLAAHHFRFIHFIKIVSKKRAESGGQAGLSMVVFLSSRHPLAHPTSPIPRWKKSGKNVSNLTPQQSGQTRRYAPTKHRIGL